MRRWDRASVCFHGANATRNGALAHYLGCFATPLPIRGRRLRKLVAVAHTLPPILLLLWRRPYCVAVLGMWSAITSYPRRLLLGPFPLSTCCTGLKAARSNDTMAGGPQATPSNWVSGVGACQATGAPLATCSLCWDAGFRSAAHCSAETRAIHGIVRSTLLGQRRTALGF